MELQLAINPAHSAGYSEGGGAETWGGGWPGQGLAGTRRDSKTQVSSRLLRGVAS